MKVVFKREFDKLNTIKYLDSASLLVLGCRKKSHCVAALASPTCSETLEIAVVCRSRLCSALLPPSATLHDSLKCKLAAGVALLQVEIRAGSRTPSLLPNTLLDQRRLGRAQPLPFVCRCERVPILDAHFFLNSENQCNGSATTC